MKRLTSLLMMASVAVIASHALSLQDFALSQSRPATIGEVRPAADARYYYQMDGPAINRVEYKSGRTTVILAEDVMPDTLRSRPNTSPTTAARAASRPCAPDGRSRLPPWPAVAARWPM